MALRLVAQRIQQRQRLGPLRRLTIGQRTYKRYFEVVDFFLRYCDQWGYAVNGEDDLEEHLIWFISCMWDDGGAKSSANYLVAGVQYFLGRRRKFPECWKMLAARGCHECPYRVPPLPPIVALALADVA